MSGAYAAPVHAKGRRERGEEPQNYPLASPSLNFVVNPIPVLCSGITRPLEVTFWSWKQVIQSYLMHNTGHDIHLWWREASMSLYVTVVPGPLLRTLAFQEALGDRCTGGLH